MTDVAIFNQRSWKSILKNLKKNDESLIASRRSPDGFYFCSCTAEFLFTELSIAIVLQFIPQDNKVNIGKRVIASVLGVCEKCAYYISKH